MIQKIPKKIEHNGDTFKFETVKFRDHEAEHIARLIKQDGYRPRIVFDNNKFIIYRSQQKRMSTFVRRQ